MDFESTIRAYQTICETFTFDKPQSWSEKFSQERYHKKMEKPSVKSERRLKRHCLLNWILTDLRLDAKTNRRLHPLWYKARELIHQWLAPYNTRDLNASEIRWPKGSEFDRHNGISLESRLSRNSKWSCTADNFGSFCALCYNHHGLKIAVKKRFKTHVIKSGQDIMQVDKELYNVYNNRVGTSRSIGYEIFCFKLKMITNIVDGSRFGTVPKNNRKRRPINIEPFGNLCTQSQVGTFIRTVLKQQLDYELDLIANYHRYRISDHRLATIDESEASDRIDIKLVHWLFPKWFVRALEARRSKAVLLPEGYGWYYLRKLSSMGNGFTFEVLTLINLALCRAIDSEASVFGDDIICVTEAAAEVITALEDVGFKVNHDKTFIGGRLLESCGAFHDSEYGYIESYDFKWPTSIGDCVALCNKAARLSILYPSFKKLYKSFVRATPRALRGFQDETFLQKDFLSMFTPRWQHDRSAIDLPPYFVCEGEAPGLGRQHLINKQMELYCLNIHKFIYYYEFKSDIRTASYRDLRSHQWAKYLAYLDAGRVTKDVFRDGQWVQKLGAVTTCGRFTSVSTLTAQYKHDVKCLSKQPAYAGPTKKPLFAS